VREKFVFVKHGFGSIFAAFAARIFSYANVNRERAGPATARAAPKAPSIDIYGTGEKKEKKEREG
jgi:hypothetical protein